MKFFFWQPVLSPALATIYGLLNRTFVLVSLLPAHTALRHRLSTKPVMPDMDGISPGYNTSQATSGGSKPPFCLIPCVTVSLSLGLELHPKITKIEHFFIFGSPLIHPH